jgi:hypothetical protein
MRVAVLTSILFSGTFGGSGVGVVSPVSGALSASFFKAGATADSLWERKSWLPALLHEKKKRQEKSKRRYFIEDFRINIIGEVKVNETVIIVLQKNGMLLNCTAN